MLAIVYKWFYLQRNPFSVEFTDDQPLKLDEELVKEVNNGGEDWPQDLDIDAVPKIQELITKRIQKAI